jgi:AAA domain
MSSEKVIRADELFVKNFPDNPSYIEPNIIVKGGTTLLGGLAKIGKSLLMMEAIRALSNGKPLFENPDFIVPKRAVCLYIEAENGPRAVKDRGLKIFGGENPRVWGDYFHVLSTKNPPLLDSQSGFREYCSIIKDIKPNVLFLDPISFLNTQDENDNRGIGNVYYTLNKFKDLVPESEMSIVISHHFAKRPWGKSAEGYDHLSEYNFRGASKWKDGADSIITMSRTEDLGLEYEAWKLRMRFLTRHGSSPPEGSYTVNKNNDLRTIVDKNHKKERAGLPPLPPLILSHPEQGDINFGGLVK